MASVDISLHPTASGPASTLVTAHSAPHPLKFYAGWFCPFVQRAWIVLEEKKIAYQYIEINPYKKTREFLDLNPRGLVPTLGCPVDNNGGGSGSSDRGKNGDRVSGESRNGDHKIPRTKTTKPLYESNIICEYLDETYTDPSVHGPRLLPQDPYERARCRIWIDFVGSRIVPAFYRFCQHQPDNASYTLDDARTAFLDHLKTWIREAHATGPFFLASGFSMVDVALAPWLCRLWLLDEFKEGGAGVPSVVGGGGSGGGSDAGGVDERLWQRWRTWAEAVQARRSVRQTTSEREYYVDAYRRYADNTTQSQVAKATREGRNLP